MASARYLNPVLVSQLNNLELRARGIVEGFITGLHKSPYHGFSVEFAEHRAYNAGESPRTIDWKVYGRTERLYTKRYEEETNLRCHLVLDISDSMRYPLPPEQNLLNRMVGSVRPSNLGVSKLEYGTSLCAALAYLLLRQRDAVGLALFDDAIRDFVPAKSRASWLLRIMEPLQAQLDNQTQFTRRTATANVLHSLAPKLGRRGLVAIISDLLIDEDPAELFLALQRLRHDRHELILFHLLDRRTEADFALPDRPLVLRDLESGQRMRLRPEQVRAQYQAQMKAWLNLLRRRCRELHIRLVELDTHQPYDQALLAFVRNTMTMRR